MVTIVYNSHIYAQAQQAYIDSGESNIDYLCIIGRLKNNDGDVISAYKSVRYQHKHPFNFKTRKVLNRIIAQYSIPKKGELDTMQDAQIDAQVKAQEDRAKANVEERINNYEQQKSMSFMDMSCIAVAGLSFIATFILTCLFTNIAYTKDLAKKYLEGD